MNIFATTAMALIYKCRTKSICSIILLSFEVFNNKIIKYIKIEVF